jgi:uncharacterized protein YkwD
LRGADALAITLGSDTFTANGASRALDVPAQNIGGRTLVPIRLPLESVGYNVGWDAATQTVLISSGESARLEINGVEQTMEFVYIGGVAYVPVGILVPLRINAAPAAIPHLRDFYLGDFTMQIREGATSFTIWEPNPAGTGRRGVRTIRADLPVIVHDEIMHIPLATLPEIAQAFGLAQEIAVSESARSMADNRENIRGREAAELWAEYALMSVEDMVAAGYSRADISYIFNRVINNRRDDVHNQLALGVNITFDGSSGLIVGGAPQDMAALGIFEVGGVPVAPIEILTNFGISARDYSLPQIRDFYTDDLLLSGVRPGLTSIWVHAPRPEGGWQGYRSVRLDLPVFALNDRLHIPLAAAASIATIMNDELEIELSLPLRLDSIPARENLRGREPAELWAAYGEQNLQELVALGFTINDINYLYNRTTSQRTETFNAFLQDTRDAMLAAAFNNPANLPIVHGTPGVEIIGQWIAAWPGPTQFEIYTIEFINEYRAQNGRNPVEICPTLSTLAWYRTSYLNRMGFVRQGQAQGVVHTWGSAPTNSIGGLARNLPGNVSYQGGNFHALSARLTAREQARAIVDGWINSPGHRNNMLRETHNVVGIGTALSVCGTRTYTYTFYGARN